jgi:hypothetical protein
VHSPVKWVEGPGGLVRLGRFLEQAEDGSVIEVQMRPK